MTFLAPWALVAGIAAALGALVLHLVARQRPASFVLPTARFIPDHDTLVSRVASRPRDLLLLALRMLLLISAGAAFAQPVIRTSRVPVGRIVLLDRSAAVASDAEAIARAKAALGAGVDSRASVLITFDSVASAPRVISALDSLGARDTTLQGGARGSSRRRDDSATHAVGSISAALVAAQRAAPGVARLADSVELVLVSPVSANELDAAADSIRALWPGAIRVERVGVAARHASYGLERAISTDDQLGPALATIPVGTGRAATRLVRGPFNAADTLHALDGGTVVRWDTASVPTLHAEGLALGDDVIVAQLGRRALRDSGVVRARWADGAPAVREWMVGAGCLREVGVAVPGAGDLVLKPGFQRIVRGLLAPCRGGDDAVVADSTAAKRLAGTGGMARSASLHGAGERSTLVPWLLGIALLCAVADPVVRLLQGSRPGGRLALVPEAERET